MTNYRKMLMDVIKGQAVEFVPFAPRLDIWYRSNAIKGTLPAKYRNASLNDIIDELDIGLNTMIPDFLVNDGNNDTLHRGIGIQSSCTSNAYTVQFKNVEVISEESNGILKVTYKTPHGDLVSISRLDRAMLSQGITIAAKTQKAVRSVKDFKAVQYLFDNAEVLPDYQRFESFQQRIGDRGIATCLGNQRESGIRLVNMELMSYEQALYEQMDYPEEFIELCTVLDRFLDNCMDAAINSPADLITVGAHFDTMLTPPPFFQRYTLPRLLKYGGKIHEKGKYMASHTDSENAGLLRYYVEGGMDVADSICTCPLTSLTYRNIRSETGNRITLYGVIPSISVLKSAMNDYDFEKYIDNLLEEIQEDGGRHIILAIADTTPPDAEFKRIEHIARLVRQVKPK